MKRYGTGLAGAIIVGCAASALGQSTCAVGVPDSADERFRLASLMLDDAAVRMDSDGVLLAASRFEPYLDDPSLGAAARYLMGLADFASLMTVSTTPSVEPEELRRRLEHAVSLLAQIDDGDPLKPKALGITAMCQSVLTRFPDAGVEADAWRTTTARALALDGGDPRVRTACAMAGFGSSPSDEPLANLELAYAGFEREPVKDMGCDWWRATATGSLVQAEAWSGNVARADALLAELESMRPDYRFASITLRPRVELMRSQIDTYEPIAWSRVAGLRWKELARDPEGDMSGAEGQDGLRLSEARDVASGMVYFRFDVAPMEDPGDFGVNLVLDADADETNGMAWWGANKAFQFDRLVTVWVKKRSGRFGGIVGVCDLDGLSAGNYTSVRKGGVVFALAPDARAIVVGLDRSLLSDGPARMIGAVGSHRSWSDDLVDGGAITVE